MPAVAIRMLGAFEAIAADGRRLALPTRKAEALLAMLARRPGERLARTRLAGLLWPDRPDAQGRGSLRQALTTLRAALEALGAEGPPPGGDVVSLAPGSVDVDVVALEEELARPAPDAARVAALCRGPLLAGFPPVEDTFDAWLDAERADLSRRVLERLRAALGEAAQRGDARALALADAALALDAAFEPAYRARMTLLARGGDRAAAVREYERCRAALARDVGVAPGPETEALRRALAAADATVPRDGPRAAPSLAIVPFDVLSDDPRHALLARGLHEDLVAALSRFRALRVLARDSVERLAARASDAVETARTLGAAYSLATSVRGSGGRVRVSVRLVETASARQLWAERLDVDLCDAFEAQDRITRAVAGALALQIDASELDAALRRPPEQLEAYACWVRGMHALRRGTAEGDEDARRLFERALELAPDFARAYTGLSLSEFNEWTCAAWDRWDERERKAYEYALEATRLDERDHVTHCILGRILLYRREFERGIEHLRRAIALNPNDPDMLAHASLGHAYYGEPERGVELEADARAIHPFHPEWYFPCFATSHFVAGSDREAIARYERAPDLFVDVRAFLASARASLGDVERAGDDARRFTEHFRRKIAYGKPFAPEDPVRFVLRVNPIRRSADRAHLLEGLARAGLAIPSDAGG